MKVAVLMGSDSDWPILKPAVELLKQFGIEPVVKVASAHRTPSNVRDFVMEADHNKAFAAFIVAAGPRHIWQVLLQAIRSNRLSAFRSTRLL